MLLIGYIKKQGSLGRSASKEKKGNGWHKNGKVLILRPQGVKYEGYLSRGPILLS